MRTQLFSGTFVFGFFCSTALLVATYLVLTYVNRTCSPPAELCKLVRNHDAFARCITLIRTDALVPDKENRYPVPPELGRLGVWKVWVENDFVFFGLRIRGLDPPWQVAVYDLKDRVDGISSLISLYPNRKTYHIQRLMQTEGFWYYWSYD